MYCKKCDKLTPTFTVTVTSKTGKKFGSCELCYYCTFTVMSLAKMDETPETPSDFLAFTEKELG